MLKELLNKGIITVEELEIIEESNEVVSLENNGNSGLNVGYTWFTATLKNGKEFDLYV